MHAWCVRSLRSSFCVQASYSHGCTQRTLRCEGLPQRRVENKCYLLGSILRLPQSSFPKEGSHRLSGWGSLRIARSLQVTRVPSWGQGPGLLTSLRSGGHTTASSEGQTHTLRSQHLETSCLLCLLRHHLCRCLIHAPALSIRPLLYQLSRPELASSELPLVPKDFITRHISPLPSWTQISLLIPSLFFKNHTLRANCGNCPKTH